MTKNFDIASKAEKGRKKDRGERNGDCCSWIEENGCVVLALADGVGHCVNDYEAAQTTCSQFIEKCRKALQNGDRLDEASLRRFCEEIDPVLARKNEMACFCAIVWKPEENESVWFHVGDTRIYRYNYREGMCQLTKDDHGTPIAVKMNGKVHTDHGSVVTATPISSAIGDMKRDFHTGRCDFLPSESLILCSDGMYGTANFAQVVRELLSKVDMEEAVSKVTTTDEDDYSLLVLRRTDDDGAAWTAEELCDEFDAPQATLPPHILIKKVEKNLTDGVLQSGHEKALTELTERCRDKRFFLSLDDISRILAAARGRYDSLPSDSPCKKDAERLVVALQRYAADARRFG